MWLLESTVDRKIFTSRNFRVLNFRAFIFHAFNFRHLSNWRKFFNDENFPIYGIAQPVHHSEGGVLVEVGGAFIAV